MTYNHWKEGSHKIFRRVRDEIYRDGHDKVALIPSPLYNGVDTMALMDWWLEDKRRTLIVPRFYSVPYGEPQYSYKVVESITRDLDKEGIPLAGCDDFFPNEERLDLVFVIGTQTSMGDGRQFDGRGNSLVYRKGWYDEMMPLPIDAFNITVGLMFSNCVVEWGEFVLDKHNNVSNHPVDYIVTDEKMIKCYKNRMALDNELE